MTKTIAITALMMIQFGLALGNYWFTFGLWPQSWASFTFFYLTSLVVFAMIDVVRREEK